MKWEDLQDGWNRLGCIEELSSYVGLNLTQMGGGEGGREGEAWISLRVNVLFS
jgi:hypothetical protein